MRWVLCALALAQIAVLLPYSRARAEDIAVAGFNEDVVTESAQPRFGHPFDISGADWAENGLSDGTKTAVGLPPSREFTSATGSGIVYHLRPYDAANVLRIGGDDPLTGTMTVIPGRYATLHILAASGTDATFLPIQLGQASAITLNFADGPVIPPTPLRAYDWSVLFSGQSAPPIAIGGMGRNFVGTTASNRVFIQNTLEIAMFETTLDLSALDLSGRVLESITFSDVNALHSATGVFAIDGTPVPEPTTILGGGLLGWAVVRRRSLRSAA